MDRPFFPRAEWRRSQGAAPVPAPRSSCPPPLAGGTPQLLLCLSLPLGTSTTMLAVVSGKRTAPLCPALGTNS